MSHFASSARPFAQMTGWEAWRGLIQTDTRGITTSVPINRGQVGTVIFRYDLARVNFVIKGVSRDNTGTALAACRMELFLTGSDTPQQTVTSDASGNFSFWSPGTGPFYIVAYKAGAPDVAGTSVNTITAATI